jgi:hypothetical protein
VAISGCRLQRILEGRRRVQTEASDHGEFDISGKVGEDVILRTVSTVSAGGPTGSAPDIHSANRKSFTADIWSIAEQQFRQ